MSGETYVVKIIRRPHQMGPDDYHATITRNSDGAQLIMTNGWRWVLKLRTRTRALQKAYDRHDSYQRKLAETDIYTR